MTSNPEFIAAVIAVLTGFAGLLTAVALYIKSKAECGSIREERATTKTERDKEAQELRDKVLKLEFQSSTQKDLIGALTNRVDDTNTQINTLNTQLAQVLVKMDNVIATLKELKEAK